MHCRAQLLLICLFATTAQADVESLRAAAGTAAADGRSGEAMSLLRQLIAEAPQDGPAHYQLGSMLMAEDGDLNAAVEHFEKAGQAGFQPLGVGYRLSRIFARQGHADRALEQLEAIAQGGFNLPALIEGEADYASLEGNARFAAALATIRTARFPCNGDERHHAFDFWIGEWDVSQNGQPAGSNTIQPILGHCTLLENWTSASGSEGKSFNYFDPGANHWRQIWIGDSGSFIEFTGEARDGGIHYAAETTNPANGAITLHKLDFTQNGDGSVRQLWQQSSDNGTTWNIVWDGHYVRRSGD